MGYELKDGDKQQNKKVEHAKVERACEGNCDSGWWWHERKSSETSAVRVRKNCLAAPSGLSVEAAAFKWLELGASENEKEGEGKSEQ